MDTKVGSTVCFNVAYTHIMHRRVNEGTVYTAGLDIPSHGQKPLFSIYDLTEFVCETRSERIVTFTMQKVSYKNISNEVQY